MYSLCVVVATTRISANNFIVTNLNDSGPGSLRRAILDANANLGADTISFQPGLTGKIKLITDQLPAITENLTINGPGAAIITVSGNKITRVFEISPGVTATISGLTISDGFFFVGAGIFNNGGTLTVTDSTLSRHSASAGGGIANVNQGALTVNRCAFSGNNANGGGVYNDRSAMIVANSTLSGNSGPGGAGLFNDGGTASVTNCTVSNNSVIFSDVGFGGGGIFNRDISSPGIMTISNCTLSGNTTNLAGGGINNIGTMTIKNSIVANTVSGGDCFNGGTFNALGVNFSTDGSCPGFTMVTSAQLNLGSLANNGGPTQTQALLSSSVAIDAVTDCTDVEGHPVTTDQRGAVRPLDGDGDGVSRCDAGAYEALFDLCIQDDSNGYILKIQSATGGYQFSDCSGFALTGTGSLVKKGGIITLQHYAADRRVSAKIDTIANKASAAIQVLSKGKTFTILDRDTNNDACNCP